MQQSIPSVWGGAWTILHSRWQIVRNSIWRGNTQRKLSVIITVLAALAFAAFLTFTSLAIVRGLQFVAREEPELVAQFGGVDRLFALAPSLALGSALLLLLFSSISFALSTFYLSRDLDMLLVTPVPLRSVFIARFVEGLATPWLLLGLLLAAPLVGYGIGLGYGLGFYIAVLVVLVLLPLLPLGLGTLLTMVLVRVIPAKRLREVMTVLGSLLGVLFWVGTQLLANASTTVDPLDAQQALRFDVPFLPSAWGARMLIAAGTADWSTLMRFSALYLPATIGLFLACVLLAERLYYNGWISINSAAGGRIRRRSRGEHVPLLRGASGAIVRKDLRTLPRDLQQLTQLLVPLIFACFWLWQTSMGGSAGRSTPFWGVSTTGSSLFICVLFASNLGLSGMSREGRSMWLLQLAPVSPWAILRAKWLLAWLPFPLFGLVISIFLGWIGDLTVPGLLLNWLILVVVGCGVAGITTGLGAMFPRFDWDNPRRMVTTQAGCISPLFYLPYAGLMFALVSAPQFLAARWGAWVYALAWLLALALTVGAVWVPLQLAAARMRALEL